jgi:hypothetical protein
MKAIILAALLVLSVGCGQVSGRPTAAVASPSASPLTTPAASPSSAPSASPSAQPSANPKPPTATPKTSPTLLFAVLEAKGTANWWMYNTVAIAGVDGYARAKTTFTPMPVPAVGCMGAILPPSAHVAAGKVYFADGKGVIRSLGIDNKVAVVATFPMSSNQQMLSFAVSPDGTQISGTLFTVPTSGACGVTSGTFTFDAYTATSPTTTNLVYHQSSTTPPSVLALTGWDAVGPIGTYPTVWASQGGGPGSTLGVKVRVDAATLRPGRVLSDPARCQVWDSNGSGAFVCMGDAVMTAGGTPNQRVSEPVSIRNADGTEAWRFTATGQNSPYGPLLSQDGARVMVCCNDLDLADSHELIVGRDGKQVNLAHGFGASGWLDATTTIGEYHPDPLQQPPLPLGYVALNAPGTLVSLGFAGLFVGTVRG